MKANNKLSLLYAQKCQQLGDLVLNLEKIQNRIAKLKSEIDVLNESVPLMTELEKEIEAEHQELMKDLVRDDEGSNE